MQREEAKSRDGRKDGGMSKKRQRRKRKTESKSGRQRGKEMLMFSPSLLLFPPGVTLII